MLNSQAMRKDKTLKLMFKEGGIFENSRSFSEIRKSMITVFALFERLDLVIDDSLVLSYNDDSQI